MSTTSLEKALQSLFSQCILFIFLFKVPIQKKLNSIFLREVSEYKKSDPLIKWY